MPLKKSKPSRCDGAFWNCSLHCLGIQSKLPLLMLFYSQCQFLSEDMGIFRSCCVGFLWRDLWSFQPAAHSPEGASNEPVSIVYVYAGVGVTKWEWPQTRGSHWASCPHGKKPASRFSRGSRETGEHSQTEGMPLTSRGGCWHQGGPYSTNMKCHPRQHWAGPLMYATLGRPISWQNK